MGPLALLGLAGGLGGLASIMKTKGIDLKKKKKKIAKDIVKKKKKKEKKVDPWIKVRADIKKRDEIKKKVEGQRQTWKRTKKGFLDSIKKLME